MPDALEIINSVIAQHAAITGQVKTAGDRMNDIDAVFNIQRESYKVAWSTSTVADLLKKRDQLLEGLKILEEGLTKHFGYEEKVFPLVLGEILVKDILSEHTKIMDRINNVRTMMTGLDKLDKDAVYAKRAELVDGVNSLSSSITDHAHAEEEILNLVKNVFQEYKKA